MNKLFVILGKIIKAFYCFNVWFFVPLSKAKSNQDAYLFLNWVVGIILLLIGFYSIFTNFLSSITLIGLSMLLIPLIRELVYSKVKMELPLLLRIVSVYTLIYFFFVFSNERQKKLEIEGEKNREQAQALSKMEHDKKMLEYNKAAEEVRRKKKLADNIAKEEKAKLAKQNEEIELIHLRAIEKEKSIERSKEEEEERIRKSKLEDEKIKWQKTRSEELLSIINNTPDLDDFKKRDLYRELYEYNPNLGFYKIKMDEYSKKISKKKSEELLVKIQSTSDLEIYTLRDLYKELTVLNPDTPTYLNKLNTYEERIEKDKLRIKEENLKIEMARLDAIEKKKKEVKRQEEFEKKFSVWDGSLSEVVDYVKENMNDPDSFSHVSTKYKIIDEDQAIVVMEYRGKNKFGGVVKESVSVLVNLQGKLIKK